MNNQSLMLAVVADTNVYVSAFVFGGTPELFLKTAETGGFQLFLSDAVTEEIAKVLRSKKLGWPEERIRDALQELARFTKHVEPGEVLRVITADPSDNRILECAAAAKADFIVSGDKHLLRLRHFMGKPIVKVAEFIVRALGSKR